MMPAKQLTYYRSGVGKLIHLARWSRSESWNAIRHLTRLMSKATGRHVTAMHRVMKFMHDTRTKGLFIKPTCHWDGVDKNFKFVIKGQADSDWAKAHDRKNVSGWRYLSTAPTVLNDFLLNAILHCQSPKQSWWRQRNAPKICFSIGKYFQVKLDRN
jgi:hypothetical protein